MRPWSDLEEQVGTGFVDGQVAQLIDQEDLRRQKFPEFGFEPVGRLRRSEGVDDVDGGRMERGITAPNYPRNRVFLVPFLKHSQGVYGRNPEL